MLVKSARISINLKKPAENLRCLFKQATFFPPPRRGEMLSHAKQRGWGVRRSPPAKKAPSLGISRQPARNERRCSLMQSRGEGCNANNFSACRKA